MDCPDCNSKDEGEITIFVETRFSGGQLSVAALTRVTELIQSISTINAMNASAKTANFSFKGSFFISTPHLSLGWALYLNFGSN
jgi:hypothetical protein